MKMLLRWLVRVLALAGVVFLVLLGLALTPIPWKMYLWFSQNPAQFTGEPDYIVILGGGGIPSESGLQRSYQGADAAHRFPEARVVLAIPYEGNKMEGTAAGKMRDELILRGVDGDRIIMESEGNNTREQAVNIAKLIDADPVTARVLLVTSPDHMKRVYRSFKKAGFNCLACEGAFSEAIEADLLYDLGKLKENRVPLPDVGGNYVWRYEIWNSLAYELNAARESCALIYYKLMGWI